jgi:hypothetical protein
MTALEAWSWMSAWWSAPAGICRAVVPKVMAGSTDR